MKNDFKDLEFLALKSKELIDRQVASYRQHHYNSGILITILTLFIPFFLNGLDDSFLIIKIIAILPIFLIIWAIILLIKVLRSRPLFQGANFKLIEEIINESYESILLNEIGANKNSFSDNEKITEKYNNQYNFSIELTLVAIVFSTILLFTNQIIKPEKKPILVTIYKTKIMGNNKDDKKKTEKPAEKTKPREIPNIKQEYRVTLNEGKKKNK